MIRSFPGVGGIHRIHAWPQFLPALSPFGLFILVVSMGWAAHMWADYDVFWHLANGRSMAAGESILVERWSWSASGMPYHGLSLPFDVVIYYIWQIGGPQALGLTSALLLGLALLPWIIMLGRLQARPIAEGLMLLLLFPIVPLYSGLRPHLVGLLCLGVIILILDRPFGRWKAGGVGLMLGMWALVHGSFPVGFAVVGIALVVWGHEKDWHSVRWVGVALGLGVLLSLLSPHGVGVWLGPGQTATGGDVAANADWDRLNPFMLEGVGFSILIVLALGVRVWQAHSVRGWAGLAMIPGMVMLLRMGLFGAPILALATLEAALKRWPSLRSPVSGLRVPVFVLIPVVLSLLLVVPRSMEAATLRDLYVPAPAVDRLIACGAPAPVWNSYNYGGYLLWRTEGRFLVGMDGRAGTVYPHEVIRTYLHTMSGQAGWQDTIRQSPAAYIMVESASAAALEELDGFRVVYLDADTVLLARHDAVWNCP